MPNHYKSLNFAALFFLAAAPLFGVGPYLREDAPDPQRLLPPPPALGSAEDVADRDEAFRVYSAHTPEQFALGEKQQNLTIFHLTEDLIPWFVAGKFPKTEALFKQVESEAGKVSREAKKIWRRPRPYKADPVRFAHVVEHEDNPSPGYPSGHAIRASLYAILLGELFPEQREAILIKARESGWLRVQGGVHTPLDIYAGRTVGQALAQAFLQSPTFLQDLAEAKQEIAAAKP